jgi:hypothetical protein
MFDERTKADFDLISSSTRVTRVTIEVQNIPELPNCETKMASALPGPTNTQSSEGYWSCDSTKMADSAGETKVYVI